MKINERWQDKRDCFLKTPELNESPFGQVGGRQDFQGITFPEHYKILNRTFLNVDLSKSSFENAWIEHCRFENILCSSANFMYISEINNTFTDCCFEKVKFAGALLGGGEGTQYKNVTFDSCSFFKTGFKYANFNNCRFVDCKLYGVDFNGSSFNKCEFVGLLKNVWFRGKSPYLDEDMSCPIRNTMEQVSFEHAELHWLALSNGCPLNTILLPQKGAYLLVSNWRNVLQMLDDQTVQQPKEIRSEIELFVEIYISGSKSQNEYLLNCQDILNEHEKEPAKIILKHLLASSGCIATNDAKDFINQL